MYLLFYELISLVLIPVLILRLLIKSFTSPNYFKHITERLGLSTVNQSDVLIHAVSVGELLAAKTIVEDLAKKYSLHISVTTPTARELLHSFNGNFNYSYLPFDSFFCIRKFLCSLSPKVVVLIESELWPSFLGVTKRRNIPVILANARISERTYTRMLPVKQLVASNLLEPLTKILASSSLDASRFRQLGADVVFDVGNIKLSQKFQVEPIFFNKIIRLLDRKVLLIASTHEGEEELIFKHLTNNDFQMILVPRHPHRAKKILQTFAEFKLVSEAKKGDHIIVDQIGVLNTLYAISDLTIVGGSFIEGIGGHNFLEPARLAKPIIMGKFYHNFSDLVSMFAKELELVEPHELMSAIDSIDLNKGTLLSARLASMPDPLKRTLEEIKYYL